MKPAALYILKGVSNRGSFTEYYRFYGDYIVVYSERGGIRC